MKVSLKWAIGGGAVLVFICAMIWGPWVIEGQHIHDRALSPSAGIIITGFRTALIAVIAGVVALLGVWYKDREHRLAQKQFEQAQENFNLAQDQFTHLQVQFEHTREKDRENSEIAREGQVTERYVEAIKLLGSENLMERLGGIHSLARIMNDSEKDRSLIAEVLCSFIRTHAPVSSERGDLFDRESREQIQVAIAALGRRAEVGKEGYTLNLRRVDLRGINFDRLNFDAADFSESIMDGISAAGASFVRAHLVSASLRGAYMEYADLRYVALTGANLGGADIWHSDMSNVLLFNADLTGASLLDTKMEGVRMWNAQLERLTLFEDLDGVRQQAEGVSVAMISEALVYESTRLPPDLAGAAEIKARIAECEPGRAAAQ